MRKKAGMSFKDLPVPYQITFVIWNMENEEFLELLPEEIVIGNLKWGDQDNPVVLDILDKFKEYLSTRKGRKLRFLYIEMPIKDICEKVMTGCKIHDRRFKTFKEYHKWYMEQWVRYAGKKRKYKAMLPIIADTGEPDFILDGWHRFHGYYAQGVKEVPVLFVDYDKK